MTSRRWPDELEPIRPQSVTDLPLFSEGEAARDRIFTAFEQHRAPVVLALRAEAWRLWHLTREPVSANSVRHILSQFPGVDARVLIAAFPVSQWVPVGYTKHDAVGNHSRSIRTFVPRGEA